MIAMVIDLEDDIDVCGNRSGGLLCVLKVVAVSVMVVEGCGCGGGIER